MSLDHVDDGKISNRCGRISILDDAKRVRKELENEQRKQRIKEVRDQSKQLARKIRQDVAAEQQRELENLQAIKAKEFNCWRDHMLAQKTQDYRQAIFEVGTAHRAAQLENKSKAAGVTGSYQQFRKQIKARRSCSNQENLKNSANIYKEPPANRKKISTELTKECSHEPSKTSKRKRHICCQQRSGHCCCCEADLEHDGPFDDEDISSSSSISLDSSSESSPITSEPVKLRQTPAVLVDIDVDSNDSVTITAPYEIEDKHVKTNRYFSAVVRSSPTKKTKTAPRVSPRKPEVVSQPKAVSPTRKTPAFQEPKDPVKPRYTQVSDLLKNKNRTACPRKVPLSTSVVTDSEPSALPPPPPPPTPKSLSPRKSPRKVKQVVAQKPAITPTMGAAFVPLTPRKPSVATSAAVDSKSVGCGSRDSNSDGLVRFYDYNNKYAKNCRPTGSVVRERQNVDGEPNAKQQAIIENNLREDREFERDKQRKKTEERGQKAMEREQIRRDCIELTEKLDALTREQPNFLPNDANLRPAYRNANAQARKEQRLNSAVEEMLTHPVVITCPEQERQPTETKKSAAQAMTNNDWSLNLGAASHKVDEGGSSADSCCSILLDYVNDQSKQLRNDIDKCGKTSGGFVSEKSEKLKNLLKRIESLRDLLLKELNNEATESAAGNVQTVVDSISSLRRERENILLDHINSIKTGRGQAQALNERATHGKKPMLEEQHLTSKQNQCHQKTIPKHTVAARLNNPIEIVIKLKGCGGKRESKVRKTKGRKASKSPRKATSSLHSPSLNKRNSPKAVSTSVAGSPKTTPAVRQNSYDSASTAYRSLPPVIANNMDALLNDISVPVEEQPNTAKQPCSGSSRSRLNPLITHYVQRLLGMTRSSIQTLGVSSSDIQTPTSSIVQSRANRTSSSEDDEMGISQERLIGMEKFIQDNRSFIQDLEETLHQQKTQSMEESMRVFDEIWQQRLRQSKRMEKICKEQQARDARSSKSTKCKEQSVVPKPSTTHKPTADVATIKPTATTSLHRKEDKARQGMAKMAQTTCRSGSAATTTAQVSKNREERTTADGETGTDARIVRYEQLTVNCTRRIAELSELIQRVREEKQRLLEVTLSSVSENGRNSTEYLDLPNDQNANGKPKDCSPETAEPQSEFTESAPLEKYKQTGCSRDSGISMSRPITALGQHGDIGAAVAATEPSSLASTHTASSTSEPQRKVRPPPTLLRFSPQLMEDEVAHELSTILEVDTPGTIRVSNNAMTLTEQSNMAATRELDVPSPVFPTFEEYVHDLHVDMTHIDPEQSIRVQHEFHELVTTLKRAHDKKALRFVEFPSPKTYLKYLAAHGAGLEPSDCTSMSKEANMALIEDLLACLRLANINARSFPTRSEYIQQLGANDANVDCIDTASLENISGCPMAAGSDTDSETMINIEEELRKRNILKQPFRQMTASAAASHLQCRVIDSTAYSSSGETSRLYAQLLAAESGIDKFTSTTESLSGELERELHKMGIQWPAAMRRKSRDADALRNSTSPDSDYKQQKKNVKGRACTGELYHAEGNIDIPSRPNLRDFLTKELLKHTSTSTSASSPHDSLKNQFLNSIVDCMTPLSATPSPLLRVPTSVANESAGIAAAGRHKTSTPVNSQSPSSKEPNTCSASSPTAQLFSGESHLSSVRSARTDADGRRRNSDNCQF